MEHKLHNRILSALLALVLVLTGFPVAAFAEGESTDVPESALCEVCGEEPCICMPEAEEDTADEDIETSADFAIFCDGLAVSALELCRSEKRTVTAENLPEGCTHQWQIYVPGASFWVNISGQTGENLDLSFALLGNLLDEGDTALVRCAALCDGAVAETSGVLSVAVVDDPVEEEVSAEETPVEEAPAEEEPEIELMDPVSGVVLGAVALADDTEAVAEDDVVIFTITIEYVYGPNSQFAGQRVAVPYIEEVPENGTPQNVAVDSPTCVGYEPDEAQVTLPTTVTGDVFTTVYYNPAMVSFTVRHYQQNVDNDEYVWVDTTVVNAMTESWTDDSVNAENKYEGFEALSHYPEEVAADSSTLIDIYYDRVYYLMSFELGGGYGVDPIYARFGMPIRISEPARTGFEFSGWVDANGNAVSVPQTMPSGNMTYYAKWTPLDTEYSAVYWVNNDDGTKTYLTTRTIAVESGSAVSGKDDICGTEAHAHTDACRTCGSEEHTHSQSCFSGIAFNSTITNSLDMNAIQAANANASSTAGAYLYFIQTSYDESVGRFWSKMLVNGVYWNVTINGTDPIYGLSSILSGSYDAKGTVDGYTAYRYPVNQLSSTNLTCTTTEHSHGSSCYTCGVTEHIHSDACSPNIAQYLDFVEADEDVKVAGDGTTTVNVYYTYRTYTIRFIYAKTDGTNYYLASLTKDGSFENSQWGYAIGTSETVLPVVDDPSGATERMNFTRTEDGYTYYYISLTAKLGSDISNLWPANNVGTAGGYYWGSWAAAPSTGYRETYGDDHANIVGTYPIMSTDMIADDQELLEIRDDGTKVYLAQNMIAWWADGSMNVANHAYHNYFEVIGETQDSDVEYNGKYYRLRETITFTAAHNGDTRVDPIKYSGYTCINDTTGTTNDTQANSQNFANNGTCGICGSTCNYCNTFYYNATVYNLKFYNYNDWLDDGSGVSVSYGTPLAVYEAGTETSEGATARAMASYPDGLEAGVYEFKGWYTTAECYDYSAVDWETITMPDSDLVLYAKWQLITHDVKVYLTEGLSTQIGETQTVTHGLFAEQPDTPSNGEEEFIGWFYKDESGTEYAFSFSSTPISKDIVVYAKWRSNKMKEVQIFYLVEASNGGYAVSVDSDGVYTVTEKENGGWERIADTETLMLRVGQARTFEAKTGNSLYEGYRTGCFPMTATHSITPVAEDLENDEPITYVFEYKEYEMVPYQVKFYVQLDVDEDGDDKLDLRPAFTTVDGKAKFVTADEYNLLSAEEKEIFNQSNLSIGVNGVPVDGGQYIELHWNNDKAVVTELYVPDDLAEPSWKLPAAYIPSDVKIQKVIVPSSDNPTTNITANTIVFIYTFKEGITDPDPVDPNNPGTVYESKYLVQHYCQNLLYLLAEDKTGLDEYVLGSFTTGTGYSTKTATASPISIPGYSYSYEVTDEKKQVGTTLTQGTDGADDVMSGIISAEDSLELNFYYTLNSYPYQVLYLEIDSNRVLEPAKTTTTGEDGKETQLKALYGAKVTEYALDIENYDVITDDCIVNSDGSVEKSIYIKMEAGETASVNTIVFYYVRKNADLIVSKTVALDEAQAKEEGIATIPDAALNQEFAFTVTNAKGFYKSVYDCTITTVTTAEDGTQLTTKTTEKLTAGTTTMSFTLKHGQTIQIHDLAMGTYTVTETYVPGFRIAVNGGGDAQQMENVSITTTLVETNQNARVDFLNSYPFFTGKLVLGKTVTKAESSDPDATEPYKVTVTLTPYDETREVARTITWTDAKNGAQSYTIAPLTDGQTGGTFTFDVWVKPGETVTLDGVPAGSFVATEVPNGSIGVISDFYQVISYNKLHNNEETVKDTGHEVSGVIHGGHPTSVTFNNTYKKGDLTINKTVTQEYENDNWTRDSFTFTVTGTTELPDGTYSILVNGVENEVTVADSKLSLSGKISISKTDDATSWSGALEFENLPAGYYTVTEDAGLGMDKYTAIFAMDPGTGLVNDTDVPAIFTFNNEYKRTTGNLQVSKKIEIVGEGHSIDGTQEFEFTVELTDGTMVDSYEYSLGESLGVLNVADNKLTFKLKHGDFIQIDGLPVGEYRVTETPIAGYASYFNGAADVAQFGTATVRANETAVLSVTNKYPVNCGTLVVNKVVVTPDDRPTDIDQAPSGDEADTFAFTVVLSNYSELIDLEKFVAAQFSEGSSKKWAVDDETKTITFTLRGGESVTLTLPACNYTIEESPMEDYTTTYGYSDGANQYIASGETESVTCTNTYKRHYGKLVISQRGMTNPNESGIYELVNSARDVVVTVMITGNRSVTVEQVPLDAYTVREICTTEGESLDWTWAYSPYGDPSTNMTPEVTVSESGKEYLVTFKQSPKHVDWLRCEAIWPQPSAEEEDEEEEGSDA